MRGTRRQRQTYSVHHGRIGSMGHGQRSRHSSTVCTRRICGQACPTVCLLTGCQRVRATEESRRLTARQKCVQDDTDAPDVYWLGFIRISPCELPTISKNNADCMRRNIPPERCTVDCHTARSTTVSSSCPSDL